MRKPAPKIDSPYVFSVSQIETFRLCPRKWAYQKIDGLQDDGNESSRLGGLVHDQLENYLAHGRPLDVNTKEGKIAMAAIPFLPLPRYPGMVVEEWFAVQVGRAWLRGLKDVEIRAGWRSKNPFISDHKTTKNFAWAKSADDLTGGLKGIGNVQAGVYAYDTLLHTRADAIDLQWTYMLTNGPPKAQPVEATITREQVSRIISLADETLQEMIEVKEKNRTALTVVQDPSGCEAFGGCAFKENCGLTPKEKFKAMLNQSNAQTSVLARLKERQQRQQSSGAPKGETAPAPAAQPVAKPARLDEVHADEDSYQEASVNPPEASLPPQAKEVPAAVVEEPAKGRKPRPVKSTEGVAVEVPSAQVAARGGVFVRALEAFWDVLAEDIAARVAERRK